jgi:class 3 adenylate cyclase
MSWLPRPAQRTLMAATARISQLWRGRPVLPRPEFSPCPDVPLIGFQLFDAIREGRIQVKGNVDRFTGDGVRFGDGSEEPFDQVILATGYRAAIAWLEGIARLDDCGFARRQRRVRSADQPGLYLVGHNYDARGGLVNIAQDARLASRFIAAQLA